MRCPEAASSKKLAASEVCMRAKMIAAVTISLAATVANMSSRGARAPQKILSKAPPIKIMVNANPVAVADAPFAASRNGRKVRVPLRVALSRRPIRHREANAPEGDEQKPGQGAGNGGFTHIAEEVVGAKGQPRHSSAKSSLGG